MHPGRAMSATLMVAASPARKEQSQLSTARAQDRGPCLEWTVFSKGKTKPDGGR